MHLLRAIGVAVLFSPLAQAGDIARDITAGETEAAPENGGYFELGGTIGVGNHVLKQKDDDNDTFAFFSPFIGGTYRYNNLFIEAELGSYDGLSLGYTLWSNPRFSLDFLAASAQGSLTLNDDDEDDSEDERNDELLDRDTFYNGAGIRLTGYFDPYILQYRLITDTHGGNGIISTLRLGRHWQVKNWNIHGIVSGHYHSAKANQYFYGIEEDEATQRFKAYKPSSGLGYAGEIGVAHPVWESWVFRSNLRVTKLPEGAKDSPIVENDVTTMISASLTYVF